MTRSKQFVSNLAAAFTCRVPQGKFRRIRVKFFGSIPLFRVVMSVIFHTHFHREVAAGTSGKLLSGNTDTCRHMTDRIWHHIHDTQCIVTEHRHHDHAGNTRLGVIHIRSRRKDAVKDLRGILQVEVPDGRTCRIRIDSRTGNLHIHTESGNAHIPGFIDTCRNLAQAGCTGSLGTVIDYCIGNLATDFGNDATIAIERYQTISRMRTASTIGHIAVVEA